MVKVQYHVFTVIDGEVQDLMAPKPKKRVQMAPTESPTKRWKHWDGSRAGVFSSSGHCTHRAISVFVAALTIMDDFMFYHHNYYTMVVKPH